MDQLIDPLCWPWSVRLKRGGRWLGKAAGLCLAVWSLMGGDTGCVTTKSLPAPTGWRDLTHAEAAQQWRNDDPSRYLVVRADFNGDHVTDEARLVVKTNGTGLALVVFLSKPEGITTTVLDRIEEAGWQEVMGISLVPPGKYRTACGKGYFDCKPGEPQELILQRPGIDYFKEEGANSVFYWDDRSASLKRVWMSD